MTTPGPATGPEPSPRVLIADDQDLVRTGFRMILTARGITVVGEAADGAEALAEARRLRPDVVLMDIRMPNVDGLQATRRILQHLPDCRVIMLTTFDLDRYVYDALAAGASGFLLKDVTPRAPRRRGAPGRHRRCAPGSLDHPAARPEVRLRRSQRSPPHPGHPP